LQGYQRAIAAAREQVAALGLTAKPNQTQKERLLVHLRANLPYEAVPWLDTCVAISDSDDATGVSLNFPRLMGTGGNDGNFDFSRTFQQQLLLLLDPDSGEPTAEAEALLPPALFDTVRPATPFAGKIGQFNPIAAGGANAAPGFQAGARVNPWDYVLMVEGALLFNASATRRYERAQAGSAAYPFMVNPSNVGYGSATEQEQATARAELWVPTWSQPAELLELRSLFAEGRAKVGQRAARTGVDFARAIATLGVSRGLEAFERYSFQQRNGLSYFAVPLGRFRTRQRPSVNQLVELDGWLQQLQRHRSSAPASVRRAQRQLETAIVALSQGKTTLLAVLVALGQLDGVLSNARRSFALPNTIAPLRPLNATWLDACYQQTAPAEATEFRLAHALAGKHLRQRLTLARPPEPQARFWHWMEQNDGKTTWQAGSLADNLVALLQREAIEAEQQAAGTASAFEPQPPFASHSDIARWIDGQTNDARLAAIARGLSLIDLPRRYFRPDRAEVAQASALPATYALAAPIHRRVLDRHNELTLPRVPQLLARAAAGDSATATRLAGQRLHASGLRPAVRQAYEPPERTHRIAAALAFPLSEGSIQNVLQRVQRPPEEEQEEPA